MVENRRTEEASSLRAFFDLQIQHLEQLFVGFTSFIVDAEKLTAEDKLMVENFVDAANNKIRIIDGYAQKLREHVRGLYAHILQIAAELPAPIALNQDAFRFNPLVNALFVSAADIDRLFKTNPDASKYLRTHSELSVPEIYAVLTAIRHEKSTLGVGMLGNILVRDLPQEAVNFSAHRLHAFSAGQEELVKASKKYLFDNVVSNIKQEMASHMNEGLNGHALDSESRLRSLANPEVYLNALIEHIRLPASLLSIEKTHFKLNKLGIKLAEDETEYANEFDIHEIIWGNQTRNVILQIIFIR